MSAFEKFAGNGAVTERLDTMLRSGRIPHALIIEGAAGTGRRTLAGMLARALACTGENKPCGECPSCRIGSNPDIVTVLPDKSSITVDRIRSVREEAYILPNQSDRRVFIIPDANLMNEQAQNALLKVLEEPPKRVSFILTCEYSAQLLPTVTSRASVLSLTVPETDEAIDCIAADHAEYEHDAIRAAVLAEDGNIGRALALLSGGGEADSAAQKILEVIGDRSELTLLKALGVIERDRQFAKSVLSRMNEMLSEALTVKMGSKRSFGEDDIRISLSRRFTRAQLLKLAQICSDAYSDCERNCNGTLMVANLCACIRGSIDL